LIRPELKETFSPRLHQQEAIDKVLSGFSIHDRGQLTMACGTGKTFTSLRLTETLPLSTGIVPRYCFWSRRLVCYRSPCGNGLPRPT